MLTVAGKAAVVCSATEGAVLVAVVLTVVRQTLCWLHVAAQSTEVWDIWPWSIIYIEYIKKMYVYKTGKSKKMIQSCMMHYTTLLSVVYMPCHHSSGSTVELTPQVKTPETIIAMMTRAMAVTRTT